MPYKNPEDQRVSARRHYQKHKDRIKQRAILHRAKSKKRNARFVRDYLLRHPCIDCGETDPIVLHFDHVRGKKEGNISKGVHTAWSLEKLALEIEKCEVRCANCHLRKTAKEFDWYAWM